MMRTKRSRASRGILILPVLALVLAACGGEGADAAADVEAGADTVRETTTTEAATTTTTSTTTTTEAPATTTTSTTTTTEAPSTIVLGEDPDVDEVVLAYGTVFDSTLGFDDKAQFIEDAASLVDTIAAYTAAGESMGGIKLAPVGVEIDGDTAAVTYDVIFGTAVAYAALSGEAVRVDGRWIVSKAEFCGFMASARTPCP